MPVDLGILSRDPTQLTPEFVPDPGAYVFLTLDLLATVEALADPEADKKARALSPKTYVGYVGHHFGLPTPNLRYNKCGIVLLSRGLPEADETRGIEESMCVAVGLSEHPTGRAPMLPNPPLPWSNVYHHIYGSIVVRIGSCEGTNSETCPQISDADIVGASSALNKDNRRIVDLMVRKKGAESTPATKPPLPPLFSEHSNEINAAAAAAAAAADSDSDGDEEEEGEGLPFEVMKIVERCLLGVEDKDDEFVPVARYSTDWETVQEFSDAKHIFEEVEAINRIIGESQKKPRQREKAEPLRSEQRRFEGLSLNEPNRKTAAQVRRGPARQAKTPPAGSSTRPREEKGLGEADKQTRIPPKKASKLIPTKKRRLAPTRQASSATSQESQDSQEYRPHKVRKLTYVDSY
ncbi:hypothetical protein FA95DRAFT_1526884 [Auriscalpium vulgare]|uniref:Uncharacterized protein n=1 Tax=Auriscalpium vulgare TaxID=40419 RepID=A0ACB8RAM7_9AGAM|nr:hypothetical protein FA95DRAFT_1526884 [Auriscalpium vulgare]